MSISRNTPTKTQNARAVRAWVRDRKIWVELEDGREVGFPAENYRRLRDATNEALAQVEIAAGGCALRWENIDEDLTISGILEGRWLR